VEFGVCLENGDGEEYRLIPSVADVQQALKDMLATTWGELFDTEEEIQEFSPAEKYAATERLWVALDSELVVNHRQAFEAENLPTDAGALGRIAQVISYFAIFRDSDDNKLIAIRRATQFKGILRQKLIRFTNNAVHIIHDDVFKLDTDFDFLIYDDKIYIWRPSAFVFISAMDGQIAACAAANVDRIATDVTCVDFAGLKEFVSGHKLAMRLVAAIKSRSDLAAISKKRLKAECKEAGLKVEQRDGKLVPAEGSEMGFLMLLDRRRYTVTLIEKLPETYEAPSRHSAARAE
jgi:hypothetical protein